MDLASLIGIKFLEMLLLRICEMVVNKDHLSVAPFRNTNKVTKVSLNTLIGDFHYQVYEILHDCLEDTTHGF